MNERLVAYNLNIGDPDSSQAVGSSAAFVMLPMGGTLIYASVAPMEDDAGATMDIQDDLTDVVTAIACATHATPGEWISVHAGGAQTPVAFAAGSKVSFDFNNAAAANRFDVTLLFLTGESWG